MTHLSPEVLKAWFEYGRAADRERVIEHLAECESCRTSLAMLTAAVEPELAVPIVQVEEVLPRGYAARQPAPASSGALAWLHRPLIRLAGATAVVLLVIWATTATVNQSRQAPSTVTSEGPGTAEEFSWETPVQASRYRITVRDANGLVLFSGETTAPPFRTDASMRAQLKEGQSYTWQVESFDAAGAAVGESVPATFRYQP